MPFTLNSTNPDGRYDDKLKQYINKLEQRIERLEAGQSKKKGA